MKMFALVRDTDESGVSGIGHIAWAVEFPHGLVALTFRDDTPNGPGVRSCYWYLSLADAVTIHGHGGKTRFVPLDEKVSDEQPYGAGMFCGMMDDMENVPLASMKPLTPGMPDGERKLNVANKSEEWVAGYLDFARRAYGVGWRTANFGWVPTLTIGRKEDEA